MEERGCETTSLDPNAKIWKFLDNCVLPVLRTEEVNMVNQETKYYIISGLDSTTNIVFEVKNNPENIVENRRIFTQLITIQSM